MVCPECGLPAREVANPFHGTGMAVHQNLIDCPHCQKIFIQTNLGKHSPGETAVEERRRPGGFVRRFRSVLGKS